MTPKKNNYSNLRATIAMAKASFRSISRSPSAVVFNLAFPLVFILVFGFIGRGTVQIEVGIKKDIDKQNPVYLALKNNKLIHLIADQPDAEMMSDLKKGRIDAVIDISRQDHQPPFTVQVQYARASPDKGNILKLLLKNILFELNTQNSHSAAPVAQISETTVEGREYKTIDFILPGQLGFALLSSGVFGTAFVFMSMRITLVIKRFFATPVKRYSIILGEALARITFALMGAIFIITIGHYAFGFTLVHGFITVVNMLLLSIFGIVIFMGLGFIVSGIAKNESTIPPLANSITLPQFLLSGTFFPITAFPEWLQPISSALPLTYLNDALRKVAFEGAGLTDVHHQLFILGIWGIAIYAVAIKAFKWE
ncbi:MAG: ABC transporter permease [Sphingobacteriaceae bacterium]